MQLEAFMDIKQKSQKLKYSDMPEVWHFAPLNTSLLLRYINQSLKQLNSINGILTELTELKFCL